MAGVKMLVYVFVVVVVLLLFLFVFPEGKHADFIYAVPEPQQVHQNASV